MKQIILPCWKATLLYCELWKITEMRDGAVYKTKNTGKHIHRDTKLPNNYLRVNFSTEIVRKNGDLTLSVVETENDCISYPK